MCIEMPVGPMLEAMLGAADFIYFTRLIDSEGEVSYRASVRAGGQSRHVERDSLAEVLQAIQGEPHKPCSRCGDKKPLSQYPRRSDVGDGRASHCRECDRLRMSQCYSRKQRGRLVGN